MERLGIPLDDAIVVVASTVAIFVASIVLTRINGLRSFAKMSSFDFAMTIAVGSVIATTAVSSSVPLASGLVAIAVLFALQAAIAAFRRHSAHLGAVVDNRPLLLMDGPRFVEEHLRSARVTHDDVRARLRAANVSDPQRVFAVVLETTGDISVLHGDGTLDPALLEGVVGAERVSRR